MHLTVFDVESIVSSVTRKCVDSLAGEIIITCKDGTKLMITMFSAAKYGPESEEQLTIKKLECPWWEAV